MPSDTQTAAAPTSKRIAIGDRERKLEFDIPLRYSGGMTINDNEAKSLNQTMCENIGNNWRAKVQATLNGEKDSLSESDLTAAIAEYAATYEFSAQSVGGGKTLTPLEREALKIASQVVRAKLAKAGRSVETPKKPATDDGKIVSKEAFEGEVARFAETEQVIKIARKSLKDQEALVNQALEAAAA